MKNLLCPQCKIHRFQIKSLTGEFLVVTVNELYEIIPINSGDSLDGFDLTIIYCLGCSWSGSPQSLENGSHKKKY